MPSQVEQDYINGLLTERAGYVQNHRDDRVAQVDKELKRLGYSGPKDKATVDPQQLETATVEPVTEKATVKPRGKTRGKAKPRVATPAEETAIAATVKAETSKPEPVPSPFGTFGTPREGAKP